MSSDKPKVQEPAPDHDEITYVPGDGDPVRTKWNGVEFRANVPVKVPRKNVVQILVKEEMTAPDGSIITRAVEKRIPMVELAKTNHTFSVNGAAPIAYRSGVARVPQDPDAYRGYCINWIRQANSLSELDARWAGEQELRESCGVAESDLQFLRPFLDARREQCGAAA